MRPRTLLPSLAILAAACGSAEPAPTTPTATATPTAAPTATPTAAPTASAAAPPEKAKPVQRFWAWDGPSEGPAITGKRAWTAVPTGQATDRGRHVFISVEDFVKTDGANNVWRTPLTDLVVPVALAAPLAPPTGLKKGDPVLADNSNDIAFGLVESVDGETVKMKYVFGDLVGDFEAKLSETVRIDGALRLGVPVAFKLDGKLYAGRFLAKSATDAWMALEYTDDQPFAKAKAADVRAIGTAALKVGDACLYDNIFGTRNELRPAKVTKVIEGGLFYEVKTDKGQTWTVPFHHVSPPI